MKSIYLDNATVTKPSERAVSRMLPFLTEKWGLPYQSHSQKIIPDLEEASSALLSLVGGKGRFIFTSSQTEAINLVMNHAYFEGMMKRGKNQIVTTPAEEVSVLSAIDRMQALGLKARFIHLGRSGVVTEDLLIDVLTPRTALLSLSLVNGLTGVMQRVSEIASVCEERGVWLHLDVTHALGKMEIDFQNTGATFLTFGGQAMHAPLGTGGLFVKEGFSVNSSQEVVPAGVIAMAQAAIEALDVQDFVSTETARLRGLFEDLLVEAIPDVEILFKKEMRAPHISAFVIPGISSEAFCFALGQSQVFATYGGGAFQTLFSLLSALSYPLEVSRSAVSVALSRETTDDEVRRAVALMKEVYQTYHPLILGNA